MKMLRSKLYFNRPNRAIIEYTSSNSTFASASSCHSLTTWASSASAASVRKPVRFGPYHTQKQLRQALPSTVPGPRRGLVTTSAPLRRTQLYDLHVNRGAKLVPFAGFSMPLQYDDLGVGESHRWTREKASLFDVGHMYVCFYCHSHDGRRLSINLQGTTPPPWPRRNWFAD